MKKTVYFTFTAVFVVGVFSSNLLAASNLSLEHDRIQRSIIEQDSGEWGHQQRRNLLHEQYMTQSIESRQLDNMEHRQRLLNQQQRQMEQTRQRQAALDKAAEMKKQQEQKERQAKLTKERQDKLLAATAKKMEWSDATRAAVFAYVIVVRTDLAKVPLDDVYLKTIIDCANKFAQQKNPATDLPSFAKEVVILWQEQLEKTKSVSQRTRMESYVKYSQKIEQQILQKNNVPKKQ